jgi:deazaflavin-dependent oxidoreductase (nitroreductase family)
VTDTKTQPTPASAPAASDWHQATLNLIGEIREYGHALNGPFVGRQVLLLTTTGAKSGEERIAPLAYSRDGDDYVIIASKGGAPTHPAWYQNLLANPTATIELNLETIRVNARITEGAERQRLWDGHVAIHPGFAEYPKKTDRVIPVVVLERVAD